jgi:hypothetical protein
MSISSSIAGPALDTGRGYDDFRAQVQARFETNLAGFGNVLFTTDATGLFETYLSLLPDRQHHTCHACRRFLEAYGGLVTISPSGSILPSLWDCGDAPAYYAGAAAALFNRVANAKVIGVFHSSAPIWGTPVTGPWTHFAVTPPSVLIFRDPLRSAAQAMAAKREDFLTVLRALNEFTVPVLSRVVQLLESETIYRAEKVIGPAKWLLDLAVRWHAARGRVRENILWLAVATAPAGFCHPRSSMVGTLLEDVGAGMAFEAAAARFAAKMKPTVYQRPQAAPTTGNIARAEEVVARLGIAPALARRFARLDEIETIWRPRAPEPTPAPATGGVFAHLKPTADEPPPTVVPAGKITWEKFARTVLPTAETIQFLAPYAPYAPYTRRNYGAMATAVDPAAPPIIQWDRADRRNPVSWYVYSAGSPPQDWNLRSGIYHDVTAVARAPWTWYGGSTDSHHGDGVMLVLAGARDVRKPGLALFPEILRSELHEVRATIEAYSRAGTMAGGEEAALACGLIFSKGSVSWDVSVRVASRGVMAYYTIDRWD